MNKNKNIFIIDFCGTLVNLQTADIFIQRLVKKSFFHLFVYRFIWLLSKFLSRLIKVYLPKQKYLFLLKNKSSDIIEKEARNFSIFLESYKIKNVLNAIENLYLEYKPSQVILLSAGYYSYISAMNLFSFDYTTVASKFLYNSKNQFTGKIDRTYYGSDKARFIREKFISQKEFNFFIFTDSLSDLPILNMAFKSYLVNPGKSLIRNLKNTNYEVLK
jgi:phosphoserine phosphatase